MKNLHNALLLKQLSILKQMGYNYTDIKPSNLQMQDIMQLPNSFSALKDTALNCHLCELSKHRRNVVFGEGNIQADIMFVTEGPGMGEDSTGEPISGHAREMLNNMIEKVLLIPASDVYISNIVKCRAPNNRMATETEIYTCRPYLQKEIKFVKPKIIVTLGATAYRYLTNDSTSISKVRGGIIEMGGYRLIPTLHPNYLLRNPSAKKEVMNDILKVKELLNR